MKRFLSLLLLLNHCLSAEDLDYDANHCIEELSAITSSAVSLNTSIKKKTPEFSIANSIAYHIPTETIIIGGDLSFDKDRSSDNPTYYSYYQAFSHNDKNEFKMLYNGSDELADPKKHGKIIKTTLRSWTRVIAHPTLPYFYKFGINNLSAYHIVNGTRIWTAAIPQCTSLSQKRPLIYTGATFFPLRDPANIYVAGTCDTDNETVVLVDQYSIMTGKYVKNVRQLYNLSEIGFPIELDLGIFPIDVSIAAPYNETYVSTSVVEKYFYLSFSHFVFTGVCRIEQDILSGLYRLKKWPEHFSLINPSFMTRNALVTTKQNGLITLMDPNIAHLLMGPSKHFIRFDIHKTLGQLEDRVRYHNFTWYGGHLSHNLHLDWTLSIDTLTHEHAYVTTAPMQLSLFEKKSTVAKHDVAGGGVLAGAEMDFYAMDSAVTSDGQLISVGFALNGKGLNTKNPLEMFERKAVFQAFNNEVTKEATCVGCDIFWYGEDCNETCYCKAGYCHDGPKGKGTCFCTELTFGDDCSLCHCLDITKGLCDNGPDGTGYCKICYDLELDDAFGEEELQLTALDMIDINIGQGDKFGPDCNETCSCNTDNGICDTRGVHGTGLCLFCHKNWYGHDCDVQCKCDSQTQYCDDGPGGTGCTKYDYGGLLKSWTWEYYTIIAVALFIVFFTITWWQTRKQFNEKYDGQRSIPCCPDRSNNNNNDDEKHLKEHMLGNDNNDHNKPIHSNFDDDQVHPTKRNKYNI